MREVIPASDIQSLVFNIGLPVSSINLTYSNSGTIGSMDGDILVSLKPDHAPTANYVRALRARLPGEFPGAVFAFLPADIVSQILNFGAPAPIDIQISGPSPRNHELANDLVVQLRHIPGLVDLRLGQVFNQPELRVSTDRSRAQQLGISQHDVANNLLVTLSGTGQLAPTFWLNPETGLQYPLVAQAPQYRMTSLQDLQNLPVTNSSGQQQILGGLATITRGFGPAVVVHRDSQPIIDIYGAVQARDLGAINKDINAVLARFDSRLPKATHITVRGQVQTMTASYTGLAIGFIGAIVLVYLLIVINFQSWIDPFIIITALPSAVAGIAWMLLVTGTTLSVPALTGAIMCMGVATANSILVVSFARDRLAQGATALQAAHDAGFTRFRPVLMTALAMIIGMLPMSLGMGEGGEQNAPRGRAVRGTRCAAARPCGRRTRCPGPHHSRLGCAFCAPRGRQTKGVDGGRGRRQRRDHEAGGAGRAERARPSRQHTGQLRSAHIRPYQRLSETLARRHRYAGQGRAAPGGGRGAGSGLPTSPGCGGPRDRAGQPE